MDELIYFGAQVKDLGDGRIGGYLVRYSDPKETDLEGDFFNKSSDLGVVDGNQLPVYYQHGFDGVIKNKKLTTGPVKFDDAGLWMEVQLKLRDEYEQMIYELAKQGKLGWSSGAAGHLVEREQIGKAWFIKSWPIAEASLTPTPAEPRNGVLPLKSLIPAEALTEPENKKVLKGVKPTETNIMEEKDIQALVSATVEQTVKGLEEQTEQKAVEIAERKLEEFKATLPEVKAGYHLEVVEDEADKAAKDPMAWEQPGDFFKAVKDAAFGFVDKRLKAMYFNEDGTKASGINEAIPSQGGFLVPEQVEAGLRDRVYNTGQILGMLDVMPVTGNSMTFNAVDETSRVDGSRRGGIRGYWQSEAGTLTSSKPAFRQVDLKLSKVTALAYATDEQIEDTAFLGRWLNTVVPEELKFKVEKALFDGTGNGMPLGFLNSDALISATRENASNVTFNDIIGMWARRYAGVNDYVWLIHQDVNPELDALYLGDGSTGIIPPRFIDYDNQGTMRIKGRPVLETEYAQTLGTVGDIALVSWSQYDAIEKAGGIKSASSIHVAFTTGEQAFRFVYRFAAQPSWYSALTPLHGSNTVSPFVVLAATT